jgi:opacity protein-like surface antigen
MFGKSGASVLSAAIIGFAILFGGPAAADEKGLYVAAAIGLAIPQGSVDGTGGVSTRLEAGPATNLAVGYRIGDFRVEAEIGGQILSFGGQDIDGTRILSDLDTDPGSLLIGAFMGNVYYDFDLGSGVRPYLGVGGGIASISAEYIYEIPGSARGVPLAFCPICIFGTPTNEKVTVLEDQDWVGAYQAMAGISFEFWERTDVFLQYRFLATLDAEFAYPDGTPFQQDGVMTHSVQVGLRYFF